MKYLIHTESKKSVCTLSVIIKSEPLCVAPRCESQSLARTWEALHPSGATLPLLPHPDFCGRCCLLSEGLNHLGIHPNSVLFSCLLLRLIHGKL